LYISLLCDTSIDDTKISQHGEYDTFHTEFSSTKVHAEWGFRDFTGLKSFDSGIEKLDLLDND